MKPEKTAKEFILELQSKGIRIQLAAGQLKLKAAPGIVNSELLEKIKVRKEELITYLDQFAINGISPIPNQQKADNYPASVGQKRMWVNHHTEIDSAVYNMPEQILLKGEIDLNALQTSVDILVSRHEILRTTFREDHQKELCQYINESENYKIPIKVIDLRSKENADIYCEKSIQQDAATPFDLENGPLLRVVYYRVTNDQSILCFVLHHIICDGWSLQVIKQEILKYYKALSENRDPEPEPLSIQYKDIAAWQQQSLEDTSMILQKNYWLDKLQGELPLLDLPTELERPLIRTNNGHTIEMILEESFLKQLNVICKEKEATPFILLNAFLNALIYRYTGQRDILTGSPFAGRNNAQLHDQIGFYVNTVVLRNTPEPLQTLSELIASVKQTLLEAQENQDYPFDQLILDIQPERRADRRPIIDAIITYLENDFSLDTTQVNGSVRDLGTQNCKFDLNFFFELYTNALSLKINFNRDVYSVEFIEQFLNHFKQFVATWINEPELRLCDVVFLSPDELTELGAGMNPQPASFPQTKTISSIFREIALQFPNNMALIWEKETMSYSELNDQSDRFAAFLLSQTALNPEERIALLLPRDHTMIIAILGILKTGCAYVPVDIEYPKQRIDFILEDSGSVLTVDEQLMTEFFKSSHEFNISADELPVVQPSGLAYIIYTSGTTGLPKGTMVQHNNVVQLLKSDPSPFHFDDQDVWTMFHSYCFDFSVWEMYGALLNGARLVIIPHLIARDPIQFHELILREKVTILNQTPSAFYNYMAATVSAPVQRSMRYVIFGGEALNPAKLEPWKNRHPQVELINMYGITETTVHVTFKNISTTELQSGTSNIGRPLPTLTCYVLDEFGNLLPKGAVGELYVGGFGVTRGYINKEELTRQRFVTSPFPNTNRLYRSGDMVKLLENGDLKYETRIDNQVKIRGYRIELGEVESAILKLPEINEVVVVKTETEVPALAAYYVSQDIIDASDLRHKLHSCLPEHMIPSYFVAIATIPLTTNGKIDKNKLPDPFAGYSVSDAKLERAETAVEKKLTTLWEQILNRSELSIHDNFFGLGGDSIKAVQLVVLINNELGAKLNVVDLLRHQTIKELAVIISSNKENSINSFQETGLQILEEFQRELLEECSTVLPKDDSIAFIYPITKIEEGMIYSSLLRQDEPVYYDQFMYEIDVEDLNLLTTQLELLIQRHEALRTRYFLHSFSKPAKVVFKEITSPVTISDLSDLPVEQQRQKINSYIAEDLNKRRSFDNELLYHFQFFRLSENQLMVVWSFHHALLDGWSVSLFIRELSQLMSVKSVKLPPLAHTYRDYCAIQFGKISNPESQRFWVDLLEGYTRNKLPYNYTGIRRNSLTGMQSINRYMGSELREKLEKLATLNAVSFKSVCVAAHSYLLHLISSEEDVLTGIVTHERPEITDSELILGCFLATVPVRINFSGQKSVSGLLKETHELLIRTKENELHLTEIARLAGEKAGTQNPLFDTILNFTDFHTLESFDDSGLAVSSASSFNDGSIPVSNEMTNTLFDVEVDRTMDNFRVKIKYAPAYFNEEEVNVALRIYHEILTHFADHPNAKLTPEFALSTNERNEILYQFNDTVQPIGHPQLLHQLFEKQVTKTPNASAISKNGTIVTYNELNKSANRLAHHLIKEGITQETNIGIIAKRDVDLITGLLAILKCGGAYVPVDPEYPLERQRYILKNSGVSIVLTDNSIEAEKVNHELSIIPIQDAYSSYPEANPVVEINPHQLAYTIYTSGSTGNPKGVMIEHISAVNLVNWVNSRFEITTSDRLLFVTSVCFDLSVYDIFGILAVGACIVIAEREEVSSIARLKTLLRNEKITFWDSVPTTFNYLVEELLVEDESYIQEDLRLVFMSGDWIPIELPERAKSIFPNAHIISLGGATEGTVWSNYYSVETISKDWTSIPYGRPIWNNFFYILDSNLKPVPKGTIGELFIGGIGVARGYANDETKTNAAFMPDPFNQSCGGRMYKTGDLGRLRFCGEMEFMGRKDNQVKIRGFRVELGEIESFIRKNDTVKDVIVNCYKSQSNQNQLCAYLVASADFDWITLKKELAGSLPDYMIPESYYLLDALPLNTNGKIDRKALPIPQLQADTIVQVNQAETEMEEQIAAIWKAILKVDVISVTENIFELGADSLSIGAFVNRFHREKQISVQLRDVFEQPTIRDFASFVETLKTAAFEQIEPTDPAEFYPVTPAQQTLWLVSQDSEANVAYNMKGAFLFSGDFDKDAFQNAFSWLAERHEILRTVFTQAEDGTILQHILLTGENNYSTALEPISEESVRKQLKQLYETGLDLENGPLINAKLWQLENEQWVFGYSIHHIISDAWSMDILFQELLTSYNNFKKHQEPSLKPLRLQYKDYAVWLNRALEGEKLIQQQTYWKQQFEGKIPVLQLPYDFERPPVKTYNGTVVSQWIDPELAAQFRELLKEQNDTLFIGLMSVVYVLLYEQSGQRDIIIGSPVNGRVHENLENQIGYYLNVIPFRMKFSGEQTFRELLEQVRGMVLQNFEHRLYPLGSIINDLDLNRDVSRNPLFDVCVVLNNKLPGNNSETMDGLEVSPFLLGEQPFSQFDYSFDFFESGEELLLRLEYNTDLFLEKTAVNILESLQNCLRKVNSNPDILLRDLGSTRISTVASTMDMFENDLDL